MKHQAIYNLYPSVVTITGDTAFDVQGDRVTFDESLVQAEIARLQAEYEAKQYQRDRAAAYPSIQEQLDLLYWDKVNGTNNWEAAIEAVKTEYPKP